MKVKIFGQPVWAWVLEAFALFYLLSNPTGAAHVVNNALSDLGKAGNQLVEFVNALGK